MFEINLYLSSYFNIYYKKIYTSYISNILYIFQLIFTLVLVDNGKQLDVPRTALSNVFFFVAPVPPISLAKSLQTGHLKSQHIKPQFTFRLHRSNAFCQQFDGLGQFIKVRQAHNISLITQCEFKQLTLVCITHTNCKYGNIIFFYCLDTGK